MKPSQEKKKPKLLDYKVGYVVGYKNAIKDCQKAIMPCLEYCRKHNGLNSCKNCRLSKGIFDELIMPKNLES